MRIGPPDPSTQISVMDETEIMGKENDDGNGNGTKAEQKIREIVVLPSPDVVNGCVGESSPDEGLGTMAKFVLEKTTQCQKLVQSSSAVSFTANYLQSRVVSTELGARLAKLYEALEVKRADEFEQKLDQFFKGENQKTVESVNKLRKAFQEWEEFLAGLDQELERVAGPETQTELGKSGTEIQLISQKGRLAQNGSLLSYVQSSTYSLMFLEIVASFAVQECYEHVKKMFDSLPEFNKLGCDILLLTRRPASGGSGFLKLIGMPFRMLLNESESMRHILMHRQSAQSMAGLRALHIYTEFLCNDQPLEIASKATGELAREVGTTNSMKDGGGEGDNRQQQSGCILLDQQGRILYSYLCTDSSDWPDVEVLLEQVRLNQTRRPSTAKGNQNGGGEGQQGERHQSAQHQKLGEEKVANGTGGVAQLAPSTAVGTSDTSGEVAVHKRKCCAIM